MKFKTQQARPSFGKLMPRPLMGILVLLIALCNSEHKQILLVFIKEKSQMMVVNKKFFTLTNAKCVRKLTLMTFHGI